jgi:phage recombination protein Bet
MSTALAQLNTSMTMWEDDTKLKEIRKLFAPTLSELEFQFFVGLGKASGLNPFTREIWAVKYGKDKNGKELPAQVFIGRDGYRKAAQSHSDYDYHRADAVFENDEFEVANGQVNHKYKLINRGKLIGAYCIAKRHKSSMPHYVFVEIEEYSTGQSLWAEPSWKENSYGGKYRAGGKPATMIKKVAESQCLRACFQDLLGGTYGEEEMANGHIEDNNIRQIKGNTQTEKLKSILEDNVIDAVTGEFIPSENKTHNCGSDEIAISQEQMDEINDLMALKEFNKERIKKALSYHKVDELNQLTDAQARIFLLQLEKA